MLQAYGNLRPQIDPAARVAETAVVVGEVSVEAGASLWYGAVSGGMRPPSGSDGTPTSRTTPCSTATRISP